MTDTSYYTKQAGILIATGKDRLDYFNRMSTNNLSEFPENFYFNTVFTSDKGKIIAFVTLVNFKDETLIILPEEQAELLKTHLEKYIIMDDVSISYPINSYHHISVFTDNPEETSSKICKMQLKPGNDIFKISETVFAYINDYPVKTLHIITKENYMQVYLNSLSKYERFSDDDYTKFRIENFIPEFPGELNDNVNPMECGLNRYISYTKGCYIGQEVIARLDAQGKIPKQMIQVSTSERVSENDRIFLKAEAGDKDCGYISTTVDSLDKSLGFMRSVDIKEDGEYYVVSGENKISATIKTMNEINNLIK